MEVSLRYFPLREDFAYAQFSIEMKESAYQGLTGQTAGKVERSSKGRAMILCLDSSGSMSGTPFKALQEGAIMIGKTIYEAKDFEHLIICFYDSSVTAHEETTFDSYERKIKSQKAGGSTNFVACFTYIKQFVTKNPTDDLSVIFFTDGCDTCNNAAAIDTSLQNLKEHLKKQQVSSRFLTIGFTSSHDAQFLNTIASAGSELGNFFYIDTSKPTYP